VFGGLTLVGFSAIEPLKTDAVIAALAQIGVIILLFEVGLETNLKEMKGGWMVVAARRSRGCRRRRSFLAGV
jgi:Kef-type K+ transport system membrane component KefB